MSKTLPLFGKLFIEDGYTVTATIPEGSNGAHPEFAMTYRPIVGEERAEWLNTYFAADAKEKQKMSREILRERCLDFAGLGRLTDDMLAEMNPNVLGIASNYILLLDGRAAMEFNEAQKN